MVKRIINYQLFMLSAEIIAIVELFGKNAGRQENGWCGERPQP
jgi:hypothetical protein